MTTPLLITGLVSDPDLRGGQPLIAGTALRVLDLAAFYYQSEQLPPPALAEYFQLSLDVVYAALAYYHQHKAAMDAQIQQEADKAWLHALTEDQLSSLSDEHLWQVVYYPRLSLEEDQMLFTLENELRDRDLTEQETAFREMLFARNRNFAKMSAQAWRILQERGYQYL